MWSYPQDKHLVSEDSCVLRHRIRVPMGLEGVLGGSHHIVYTVFAVVRSRAEEYDASNICGGILMLDLVSWWDAVVDSVVTVPVESVCVIKLALCFVIFD